MRGNYFCRQTARIPIRLLSVLLAGAARFGFGTSVSLTTALSKRQRFGKHFDLSFSGDELEMLFKQDLGRKVKFHKCVQLAGPNECSLQCVTVNDRIIKKD